MPFRVLFFLMAMTPVLAANHWENKIEPALLSRGPGPRSFFLVLDEQADLSAARVIRDKSARGRHVFQKLSALANQSQANLIQELEALGVAYQPFWIFNMILVEADDDIMLNLAQRSEVSRVLDNPLIQNRLPEDESEQPDRARGAIENNIALTGAPEVWAMGVTGEGVVIGGQDTGYDWDHPALIRQYRGWDGDVADHNYHWRDAIHASNGPCGANSPEPCDDHSHGSHTMGTALGDDGLGNQIGMAPDAQWIGCRNMDGGNGTPATYAECLEWFVAPTDLNGENPDPDQAPHVLINSWSCPASEGCTDPLILQSALENVRAAGIVVVAAAGNSGPSCGSIATPPPIYEAAFSVGATNASDAITGFSSRGAVSVDGSFRLKPDVVAPGQTIRSSVLNGGYGFKNGTSMACPHVSGLVALIISAVPELAGDVDAIEEIIRDTALGLTSTQDCHGFSGSDIPNPIFGHGRIRALEAVQTALGIVPLSCKDFSAMVATWPRAVTGRLDGNQNGNLDILDLIPLAHCGF